MHEQCIVNEYTMYNIQRTLLYFVCAFQVWCSIYILYSLYLACIFNMELCFDDVAYIHLKRFLQFLKQKYEKIYVSPVTIEK